MDSDSVDKRTRSVQVDAEPQAPSKSGPHLPSQLRQWRRPLEATPNHPSPQKWRPKQPPTPHPLTPWPQRPRKLPPLPPWPTPPPSAAPPSGIRRRPRLPEASPDGFEVGGGRIATVPAVPGCPGGPLGRARGRRGVLSVRVGIWREWRIR